MVLSSLREELYFTHCHTISIWFQLCKLCVQFSLIIIGFASLEAKRKFRAPRSSPNQPPSCNSYLSLKENVVEEDTPQTNCLDTLFPIQSDNEGNVPLPDAQASFQNRFYDNVQSLSSSTGLFYKLYVRCNREFLFSLGRRWSCYWNSGPFRISKIW